MCGIVGEIKVHPDARVDASLIERMCTAIVHRGPDDQGVKIDGGVGLGMRRLSIIDLSGGHQPMTNEDGSITVVFNGEIYNFQALRSELEARGHRFRSNADTEVIVHLYEEHGDACVDKLRGMFAFAVWDARRRRLLLARDRLGVKPLYYYQDRDRLLFGSEIKSILQDPSVPRTVDPAGLDQMLSYGYFVAPTTCFEGIHELPLASTLTYLDGHTEVKRYWDLAFHAAENYDEIAARERLLTLVREATRMRMISDVPLGALLSGGIDSALIVSLMSEASEAPVKTFSIGFDAPGYSELPLARQVAERYRTEHHEFVVKPDVAGIIPMLIRHHDAPFYDSSAIPTYYVCKLAREHVTVALSGDGGDELFAGYRLYAADKAAGYYQCVPRWIRNGVLGPLARCIPETSGFVNKGRVIREFLGGADLDYRARHARWTAKAKPETRHLLYKAPALVDRLDGASNGHLADLFDRQPHATVLNQMLYVDINTELTSDILVKVDRMSMASSLEVRSPLLDHHVHEFAATLPDAAKLNRWTKKYMLKRLAADRLPPDLLKKPKQGFSIPLDRWLREDLADCVRDVLLDRTTRDRGYFHQPQVEHMLTSHMNGPVGYGRELWTLLTVELWHRMYIDTFEPVTISG